MVELLIAATVAILAAAAEALHALRARRVARLAFGPKGRPAAWARLAPLARVAALAGVTWALVTLYMLEPKVHRSTTDLPEKEMRHLLILLDVSPSMRLVDAGPEGKQSRRQRARDLVESLLNRVAIRQYMVTIVATYNGAIPVVEKSRDQEVIRNIFNDLPMQYAFKAGGTNLFAGLEEAARIAQPWRPRSGTLLLISDGDTVAATGMPHMPPSVANVLVLGVGNSQKGMFIDGRNSKQEASTLRQIATRLGGVYHDGNEKHISSDIVSTIGQSGADDSVNRLSRREYALVVCIACAAILAVLPLALQHFGTRWKPGVRMSGSEPVAAVRRERVQAFLGARRGAPARKENETCAS